MSRIPTNLKKINTHKNCTVTTDKLIYNILYLPVWMPILSFNVSCGLCSILWCLTASNKSRDIEAISPAWLSPFLIGKPDT